MAWTRLVYRLGNKAFDHTLSIQSLKWYMIDYTSTYKYRCERKATTLMVIMNSLSIHHVQNPRTPFMPDTS